jgi:hypothetical protein
VPGAYAATLGAYLALLAATGLTSPSVLDWIGSWPRTQLAVIVPAMILWLFLFVANYRRTSAPAALARARWAALGGIAAAVLGLALFQVPELLSGRSLLPPSWIGLVALLLPLGVATGILRDRLFDIEVVVNRALVYGGMTLGVVGAYVVSVSALTTLAGREPGFGGSLLATGLAALVALPLRDRLQRAVNRLMYGERDEPWRAIRRLGQRLEWAAEPGRAFPAIVDTVAEALRSPFVTLETVGADGTPIVAAQRGTPTVETARAANLAPTHGRLVIGVRSGEEVPGDELRLLEDLARGGAAVRALACVTKPPDRARRGHARRSAAGCGTISTAGPRPRRDRCARGLGAAGPADPRPPRCSSAPGRVAGARHIRRSDGLSPALDELGLIGAIAAGGAPERAPGTTRFRGSRCPGRARGSASSGGGGGAYRIAVEAVSDAVARCAQTCRPVEADDDLAEVVDDGRGSPGCPAGNRPRIDAQPGGELGGEVIVSAGRPAGPPPIARGCRGDRRPSPSRPGADDHAFRVACALLATVDDVELAGRLPPWSWPSRAGCSRTSS